MQDPLCFRNLIVHRKAQMRFDISRSNAVQPCWACCTQGRDDSGSSLPGPRTPHVLLPLFPLLGTDRTRSRQPIQKTLRHNTCRKVFGFPSESAYHKNRPPKVGTMDWVWRSSPSGRVAGCAKMGERDTGPGDALRNHVLRRRVWQTSGRASPNVRIASAFKSGGDLRGRREVSHTCRTTGR